ncbi:hypothetical protein ABKW28_08305 [Nocardioides sp. 31GB23]|uniref:hypothetical protein n=1 Tax=Nocardioides sp. 31GB23 TaxID=3156065 RepID=UPI0032AF6F7E
MTAEHDETAGERRAWAWSAHLLDGGTTPWSRWAGTGERAGRVLPGAQQLELLRRLNLATHELGVRPEQELARRVLEASAPGRGRPDLELLGAAPLSRFGPEPVDPAGLPADELVRVATNLLAEDLSAAPLPGPGPVSRLRRAPRPRPWRPRYRLVGDPWRADATRRHLVAHGRPPGGPDPTVLVLGGPLSTMLVDLWTDRAFSTGGPVPSWRTWVDTVVETGRLGRGADPVASARRWTARVGADRVRVVLDPAALPGQVGVRRVPPAPRLPADAIDLARRVGSVLGLLVTPARGRQVLRQVMLPRLLDAPAPLPGSSPGPVLGVPPEHHRWLVRRSRRMRHELLAAPYPVVGTVLGSADALLDHPRRLAGAEPGEPHDDRVLDLAVRMLLEHAEPHPGAHPGRHPGRHPHPHADHDPDRPRQEDRR